MTQYMMTIRAAVPQEVIEQAAMDELRKMRERARKQESEKSAAELECARREENRRRRILRELEGGGKPGMFQSAADRIGAAWCIFWGILIVIKDAIRDFGLDYGLWVYEPDEE